MSDQVKNNLGVLDVVSALPVYPHGEANDK